MQFHTLPSGRRSGLPSRRQGTAAFSRRAVARLRRLLSGSDGTSTVDPCAQLALRGSAGDAGQPDWVLLDLADLCLPGHSACGVYKHRGGMARSAAASRRWRWGKGERGDGGGKGRKGRKSRSNGQSSSFSPKEAGDPTGRRRARGSPTASQRIIFAYLATHFAYVVVAVLFSYFACTAALITTGGIVGSLVSAPILDRMKVRARVPG